MTRAQLGIGTKLNLGLGLVLIVVTAGFGLFYVAVERERMVEIQHEHVMHMARLIATSLGGIRDRRELQSATDRLCESLSSSTGSGHRISIEDERGRVLASRRSEAESTPEAVKQRVEVELAALRIELPLSARHYQPESGSGRPSRLVLEEFSPWIDRIVRTSIAQHLLFAAFAAGLAMLAAGAIVHRLVSCPLRELVTATDEIARGGEWAPISPSERRGDEIGVLQNHMAQMSRRLVDAVRVERYGSAHLIVERVRREMDAPLHRATTQLALLEPLLRQDSEAARARTEIAAATEKIEAIVRRLAQFPSNPQGLD